MTHEIKAVIWDMGGVILRSMDWNPRKQLAKEHSLTLDEIHDLVFNSDSARQATLGKINDETHWANIGKTLGISGIDLQRFRTRFFEGDELDQNLVDFIRSLKPKYTTALLSNAWSDARGVLTYDKPCMDAFHLSVFSCEAGLAKPDPEIYRYIIRLCGIEPSKAIFVDDAQENIDAANDFGINAIRFVNAVQARRDVENLLTGGQ